MPQPRTYTTYWLPTMILIMVNVKMSVSFTDRRSWRWYLQSFYMYIVCRVINMRTIGPRLDSSPNPVRVILFSVPSPYIRKLPKLVPRRNSYILTADMGTVLSHQNGTWIKYICRTLQVGCFACIRYYKVLWRNLQQTMPETPGKMPPQLSVLCSIQRWTSPGKCIRCASKMSTYSCLKMASPWKA